MSSGPPPRQSRRSRRRWRGADFAALVVTPDDMVLSKDAEVFAARDNVIWEHGLFTGALGRARTFIVRPRDVDIKLPTDLLAVTPLDFPSSDTEADLRARLGPVINGIRKAVLEQGPK